MKHRRKKIRKYPSNHVRMDCPPQAEGKVSAGVWKLIGTPLLTPSTLPQPQLSPSVCQGKLKEKDIMQSE